MHISSEKRCSYNVASNTLKLNVSLARSGRDINQAQMAITSKEFSFKFEVAFFVLRRDANMQYLLVQLKLLLVVFAVVYCGGRSSSGDIYFIFFNETPNILLL